MIRMPDLDATIRGLMFALQNMCLNCSYDDLVHDAITLLKDQQPRVLSYEELEQLPLDDEDDVPVWCEIRIFNNSGISTKTFATLLFQVSPGWWRYYDAGHDGWEDCKEDSYGYDWRCWNTKPSDERRKVEPWNAFM